MHLRPRHVVGFDVVGVELDEAGHDEVAGHVLGAGRRRAAAESEITPFSATSQPRSITSSASTRRALARVRALGAADTAFTNLLAKVV